MSKKNKAKQVKTVYVLGAGFSVPIGMPPQAQILKKLDALSIREQGFLDYRETARKFVQQAFCASSWTRVPLEDVYTLLDRSIGNSEPFRGYSPDDLRNVRDALSASITFLFDKLPTGDSSDTDRSWLTNFAKTVAQHSSRFGQSNRGVASDTISIISLNWDIVLDRALFNAFVMTAPESGKPTGAIDYGTYFDPYDTLDDGLLCNGLVAAVRNLGTVKLLKLHASMNWLYCSECGRLFAKASEKIALRPSPCRRCQPANKNDARNETLMYPLLLTPTFVKDLSNIHMKQIWHTARLKLREAERIVFVGYSFPQADYEFRLLLVKNIARDATIQIVDYAENQELGSQHTEMQRRYENFFGERNINFNWCGAGPFMNEEAGRWQEVLAVE